MVSEAKQPDAWYAAADLWRDFRRWGFDGQVLAQAAAETQHVVDRLELTGGETGLDLCCGVGRHTLPLARRGFRMTGVDLTAEYVRDLAAAARREQLPLEAVQADMREYRREGAFDFAINLYTSFGYFRDEADNQRVLENLAASLSPGGRLLIEVQAKEVFARDFRERDWYDRDGLIVLERRRVVDGWRAVETDWTFIDASGRRTDYTVYLRCYGASELCRMLDAAGFTDMQTYGDLTGRPYDHTAARLVVRATKAGR